MRGDGGELDVRGDALHAEARAVEGRAPRPLFDLNPALMLVTTWPEEIIVDANRAFCAAVGMDRACLIGRSTYELALWARPERRNEWRKRLESEPTLSGFEIVLVGAGGRDRALLLSSARIDVDGAPCVLDTAVEIPEGARSAQARRDGEAKYREMFERVNDAIFITDAVGRFVEANPAMCRQLGYARAELLRMSITEISPQSAADFASLFESVRAQRGASFETQHLRKDGARVAVELGLSVTDYEGRAALFGVARDVTERRRAEQALRESEARFRALFDTSHFATSILDASSGRFLAVNPAFERMTGLRAAEVIGKDPVETGAVASHAEFDALYAEALNGGRLELRPLDARNRNGDLLHLLVSATRLSSGDDAVLVSTSIDVTPLRRAEAALQESEARFRALFEAAPDAFVIHDLDGRVIDGNRAAEALCRLRRDETIGKSIFELGIFPAGDRETAAALLRAQRNGQKTGPDELEILRPDGTSVTIEVRAEPIQLGTQVVVLVIARDVSARKQAEVTRRQLEERLHMAAKLEAVGQLAGGVAHDFNNLLTGIICTSELLLDDLPPDSPTREDAAEIKDIARRAASLTSQLLAFSRRQVTAPEVVDLNDIVSRAIVMLKRIIGEHIELRFVPGKRLGKVCVDPNQVDQILVNLAVNARDAMSDGGTITIETARFDLDEAAAAAYVDAKPGAYVRLTMRDTGTGMSSETLRRIFEPFFTTKETGRGTGLGLATVYGVVKQSAGAIRVTSEVGAGSTFDVLLPLAAEAAPSETRVAIEEATAGSGNLVLVEDELLVRKSTTRLLQKLGYQVIALERPEAAIRLAEDPTAIIDLLITDVVMPGINGRMLYDRLRAIRPTLPVLFISGYSDEAIAKHGVLADGTRLLQKPFSLEALGRAVRRARGA